MNELLTLVHDFNTNHKADAFFSYAGHVNLVEVIVNHSGTTYKPGTVHERIFEGTCYLDDSCLAPSSPIEELTEAFRKFAEGYEE